MELMERTRCVLCSVRGTDSTKRFFTILCCTALYASSNGAAVVACSPSWFFSCGFVSSGEWATEIWRSFSTSGGGKGYSPSLFSTDPAVPSLNAYIGICVHVCMYACGDRVWFSSSASTFDARLCVLFASVSVHRMTFRSARSLIARVEALGVGTPRSSPKAAASSSPAATSTEQQLSVAGESATVPSSRQGAGRGGGGAAATTGGGSGGGGGGDRGSLIILVQVVCSCLRHLRYPRSRLLALNLLVAFGRCCDDEARLQRLVPVRERSREFFFQRGFAVCVCMCAVG